MHNPTKKDYQKGYEEIERNKGMKRVKRVSNSPTTKLSNPTLFKFKGVDGKEYKMKMREKLFCELYMELKGNGTEAIIEAGYDVTNSRGEVNRNVAKNMASEYLAKPNIYAYVTILLTRYGFDSENVEKQHLFLINQFGDLSAKGKGIDMYYKLKGKYPKEQLEISLISKYKNASDEELEEILEGEIVKDK